MHGPYLLYYVAEHSRCSLDGISGPRVVPSHEPPAASASGEVEWGPDGDGWEEIHFKWPPTNR
jgi:hypothetical protein